ncbi:uncharacterized protein LOC5514757 [Nematostella vectensis]|uniref:uncharacterized protein LOC5514757 n=1 Tax=Nematostella vectensis TaxID=45351 RepID=UPI0020773F6B|nr:uncharacterized protein LOC5514757 [Nematostella vectensis]XP_048590604.1 uncharacterized protein LOC5514757 [Nematostella vectensis]
MAYRAQGIRKLGISQMVIGALMVVFGIASVAAVHMHWTSIVGFGIWIGVWVIVTGVLGFIGARDNSTPNNCLIGTMLGFAVTSCVLSGIMIICYSIALAEWSKYLDHYYYGSYYYYQNYYSLQSARAGLGIGVMLLLLALAEFFVGLASSIYGCSNCCTSVTRTSQQQVIYLQGQPGQSGQPGIIVLGPNGAVAGATTTYPNQAPIVIQQPGGAQAFLVQGAPQGYPQGYPQQQQQPYQTKGDAPPAYSTQ